MKYFTKYLPVEGEIREGDKVKLGGALTTATRIDEDLSESAQKLSGLVNRKEWYNEKGIKQKLFLCSRDIQVGDRFISGTGKEWVAVETYQESTKQKDALMFSLVDENCYKVIGEISPDALSYVREGQEFEEEDLHAVVWDGIWHNPPLLPVWPDAYSRKIRIKGPCGHFH